MRVKAKCSICGAEYYKTNGKSKYCSAECKAAGRKITLARWNEAHPDYQKQWHEAHPGYAEMVKEAHPNYDRDRSRVKRGSKKRIRNCIVCGKKFTTYIPHKWTCSDECKKKHILKRIPDERIIDTDITLKVLFERDGGICYLCGKPCDWSDRNKERKSTGAKYPSIDHVIPKQKAAFIRGTTSSWHISGAIPRRETRY